MTSPNRKEDRRVGIASLPDDLLCKVFRHLLFTTKLQCQTVCTRWHQVLKHPCCKGLWGAVPVYILDHYSKPDLHSYRERVQLYTDWLASRARGILAADIGCEDAGHMKTVPKGETELSFFVQQQLPYLLGCMHLQKTHFDLSLTTGMCQPKVDRVPC